MVLIILITKQDILIVLLPIWELLKVHVFNYLVVSIYILRLANIVEY